MNPLRLALAALVAFAILAPGRTSAQDSVMHQAQQHAAARLPVEGEMPSLGGATGWLNSPPLTAAGLRGRVVLVDFWTYTCINWLRTLPYVRAWAEKYRERGLVVIGVHSPEFGFEKDADNVRRAVTGMQVSYPVAIDSEHAVWRGFNNQYWPALYFIDTQGRNGHHQFGEGDYEGSERVIQQLLVEAGNGVAEPGLVTVDGQGVESRFEMEFLDAGVEAFAFTFG